MLAVKGVSRLGLLSVAVTRSLKRVMASVDQLNALNVVTAPLTESSWKVDESETVRGGCTFTLVHE